MGVTAEFETALSIPGLPFGSVFSLFLSRSRTRAAADRGVLGDELAPLPPSWPLTLRMGEAAALIWFICMS